VSVNAIYFSKKLISSCRRREADDAYALGIARKAQPVEHLESRYEDFQKRMMSSTSLPAPQPATSSRPPRQALAQTSLPSSTQPSQASPSNNIASSSRLEIFVDPTGEETHSYNTNEWSDLGTRKTRIKENAPEVKKMVGSTIKQPGKSKRLAAASVIGTGTSSSGISVFRDPAPGLPPAPSSSQKPCGSASGLGQTPAKGFTPFVDAHPKETPAGVSAQQAGAPVMKFTPFRDEASRASFTYRKHIADIHPQSVRGFISGCCCAYRYLDHENQEGGWRGT